MPKLKSQSELDEMYGRVARRYNLLNRVITFGLDGPVRRAASKLARPGRILDVGTGTGVSARDLSEVHAGSTVVGTDRSAAMLEIAAADGSGPYVKADVRALPFADATFDSAVSGFVFRPIEGDGVAVGEVFRVLKTGGRAVIYDVLRVPAGFLGSFYRLALALYIPLCAFILADDPAAYLYFTRSIRESVTADELAKRFRSAGFSSVKIEKMIFGTVTLIIADKPLNA